jgi:NTE family protein
MDIAPAKPPGAHLARPEGTDRVALILQGGGALGAYQGGVYQALHEAGVEPDWVAGVSIGGINGAIIAGNTPENRLPKLREFWDIITSRQTWMHVPDGDDPRKLVNAWSSFMSMALGQPGFFEPHRPNPWLSPRGAKTATAFYDNAPLRETLLKVVDFDLLNSGRTRYACGAVNVRNGNFTYFDNADGAIRPEHIMASGALPPALPMIRIGGDCYWDGGLVSNTPLQHVLDHAGHANTLVFQVDLFSARGDLPRDMHEVLARQKDIQYSSRTRLVTDYYTKTFRMNRMLKSLLDRIPEDQLSAEELHEKAELKMAPALNIVHLIYQQMAYEGQAKDYDFSRASMREHWESGYRDTRRTLRHRDWLEVSASADGIKVRDVHREAD